MTNTAAVGGAGVNLALKLLNGETVETDPAAPKPNTVLLDPVLADNVTDDGKSTLESWQSIEGIDPLWPLGLEIEGWTTYTPATSPSDLQGSGRVTSASSSDHRGTLARRHPPLTPPLEGPMTVTTTDLLLEATGIAKRYGAVVALQDASLAVRPGEVHALMGANGAGKSTLVKILTGAVRPDARNASPFVASRGRPTPQQKRGAAASSRSTRNRR